MKKKDIYLSPDLSVMLLRAMSIVCASGLGGTINASEEVEDNGEWTQIN